MEQLTVDIALARRAFELRVALTVGAETVAVLGPSGAGKSSLLRSVAGLERPHHGRVMLADEVWLDVARRIRLAPEHRHVGYVPQDYGLFGHLTVAGNIRFAGGRDRPDLLERFGLAGLARARPSELSGGERQRVALARALAREARVLLLDEPFAALDAATRQAARDDLADQLAAVQLPTLLVTHSFDDASALATRVAVIEAGRLIQVDEPAALLRAPATPVVAALTGANVLAGMARRSGAGSTIALDGGGELVSASPADGPVHVAVQPWELKLTTAASSALTDEVLSVRPHAGGTTIRLRRFVVHVPAGSDPEVVLLPGVIVGLGVTGPADVRVIAGP